MAAGRLAKADANGRLSVQGATAADVTGTLGFTPANTMDARFPVTSSTTIADANYAIQPTDQSVAITSLTATRTWTLPSSYPAGQALVLSDASGSASPTTMLVITAPSGVTINNRPNPIAIASSRGIVTLHRGPQGWSF